MEYNERGRRNVLKNVRTQNRLRPSVERRATIEEFPWSYTVMSAAQQAQVVALVVDHEAAVRNIVRYAIQSDGHAVILAANGQEALTLSRAYPGDIHVLVTDIRMPEMDGAELAAQLIRERPNIRVLVISGDATSALTLANVELPFLQKPFRPQDLREKLRKVLVS